MENKYKNIQPVNDVRQVYFQAATPAQIWSELIEQDTERLQRLCEAMRQLVFSVGAPKWLVLLSAKLLYGAVYKHWGHYIDESDYIASRCKGISASLLAFMQRQYTLSHMGCSVVMAWDDANQEMMCYRSLDWQGANDIAFATREFSFVDNDGQQVARVAGITGMVGVLTGVKSGYSIAINFAPWKRSARFKSDPTFLIRQLLEDRRITSYQAAHKQIQTWVTGSPCFISLCGINKGEATVFEFGAGGQLNIREMGDAAYLVQTNHYDPDTSPFVEHNAAPIGAGMDEDQLYHSHLRPNSQHRRAQLSQALDDASEDALEDTIRQAYLKPPVLNYETAQWVVMRPASGTMNIYACIDKDEEEK